ncbi:hypothetical protein B0A52_09960 [Exophiala mesophila]|uniref:Acyltransferase 3 domain-containing protein n=1 Tax=Exophiala mesophila TaxID=212818 RepID=A0A438MT19_EXOME|nr:hypothetical protein B0A52_09960 [Exophiala mesophila]
MAAYVPLVSQDPASGGGAVESWTLTSEKYVSRRDRLKARLIASLPRFAQPGGLRHRKIGPTSYLDALRGYAACCVFIAHSFNSDMPTWRRQPFVSIVFNGAGMVALFFVISGYALGCRMLMMIRKQESEKLLNSLASSTFRRYIRLYLSSIVAMFYAMVLVRLQLYNGMHQPMYRDTLWLQLVDFMGDVIHFMNPFGDIRGWVNPGVFDSSYLGVLWSIPVEYRGSIALFAFCTGVCKMTTRARMISTWVIIVFCYIWQACYISGFMGGFFIADLSLSRHPERYLNLPCNPAVSAASSSTSSCPQSLLSKVGHITLLVLGILLLGQTDSHRLGIWGAFPWGYLRTWEPYWWDRSGKHMFWLGPGAFLLCYALEFYPALQRPLHWRFSQYLGDISFGIYVTHVPTIIATYYKFLVPWREATLGSSYLAFFPGIVLAFVIIFTVSDYFSRVDAAVVKFARWSQSKLFIQWH